MSEVAVVVASHDRPLRLRWLLNALEEQTLARDRFEVVVAHDSASPETEELLRAHPLASAGVLRHLTFAPGSAGPAKKRNAAWREASARLIAFTDDDCRPPEDWLERALEQASRNPDSIVQGATEPDPDEAHLLVAAGFHRSVRIDPPVVAAQTCNILYPRAVLEALGGFDESLREAAGEDTELAWRARESGTGYVGAPELRMFHMVDPGGLVSRLRGIRRWRHLPYVVRLHPGLRREFTLGFFWKPAHAWLVAALAGTLLARRRPFFWLVPLAYLWMRLPSYGPGVRGRGRAVAEAPGHVLVDAAELAACAEGSVRHRTLFL